MIEDVVRNYLDSSLDVNVYLQMPSNPPQKCVLIERVGGGSENHIKSASFAIKSYGESLYEAANLNEQVKIAMEDITGMPAVGHCSLDSDYNYTDTRTSRFRYQAVFDLNY